MYIESECVVNICAPGRKHIKTEVCEDGRRTIFTITFEEVAPRELQVPDFVNKDCTYNEVHL